MSDDLGDRMKMYEMAEAGRKPMPLVPAIARIDGRCFSSFTRGIWSEFIQSFKWIEDATEKWENVMKVLSPIVVGIFAVLGITAYFTDWAAPFAPYLLCVFCIYLTWKAAIAWHKTSGPAIWISEFSFDDSIGMFDLIVRNVGSGEVFAKAFAQEVMDKNRNRIARIDSQIEAHWRGLASGEKLKLVGNARGVAGFLMVVEESPGVKCLGIHQPTKTGEQPNVTNLLPMSGIPLDKQEPFYLSVRVDFYDENEELKVDKVKEFLVTPDPSSKQSYSLKSV